MKNNELIKKLYFEEKYNQTEIAKKLSISNKYVSKVLNNDPKYKEEKEKRKAISKEKHKNKTISYIRNKRKKDITYDQLKQMHIQASRELSGGRKSINNRAYKKWNSSVYRYDNKTKSYILKKEIKTGYDVPKRVSWK